jgi:transcriptional regulator with XRE-family HTH domain
MRDTAVMDTDHRDDAEARPRRVTANQLVAYNMARWRKAAGLTQAELGDRLGGWSNRAVSAAERSFDPDARDRREFDADTLLDLAAALDVPLAALFLSPADDGDGVDYVLAGPGPASDGAGMGDVFAYLFPDPGEEETPLRDAYREAFRAALGRYLDPAGGSDYVRYLDEMTARERRAELLDRLAWQREALLAAAGDLGDLAKAIKKEEEREDE